jgi:DNA-binding NtrC family response regulator
MTQEKSSGDGDLCCEESGGINPMVATAFGDMDERGGGETILLVEDEDFIRGAVRAALEAAGYRVVAAGTASEAKEAQGRFARAVDLLLTDVVMPGVSGRELAADLLGSIPGLRVLLMSGYAEQLNGSEGWPGQMQSLAKPFSVATLLTKVRGILDQRVNTLSAI